MKEIKFISLFSFLLLLRCSSPAPLSGTIELPPSDEWAARVYLIQPGSLDEVASSFLGQVLDSAVIDQDGSFAFKNMPATATPVLLELAVQRTGERYPNRLENSDLEQANYFPIVWKNGMHLEIRTSAGHFQRSFSFQKSTPENIALLNLRDVRFKAYEELMQHEEVRNHDDAKLLEEEAAWLRYKQALMDFADQTTYLLPAAVAIRWVSPEKDYERVPEFLVSQCEKWKKEQPDHPWVSRLCEKSARGQLPVLRGDTIPEAMLPLLEGEEASLHSLMGKKLTLLDLWASWCAPCRRENREILVPMWDKFHEQGFQIIGYALESSKTVWEKAIEKDGVYRWPHASHLQGDDAPLLEVLRIQSIPANFLLDKDGRILAKNLHGEELAKFIEKYMTT